MPFKVNISCRISDINCKTPKYYYQQQVPYYYTFRCWDYIVSCMKLGFLCHFFPDHCDNGQRSIVEDVTYMIYFLTRWNFAEISTKMGIEWFVKGCSCLDRLQLIEQGIPAGGSPWEFVTRDVTDVRCTLHSLLGNQQHGHRMINTHTRITMLSWKLCLIRNLKSCCSLKKFYHLYYEKYHEMFQPVCRMIIFIFVYFSIICGKYSMSSYLSDYHFQTRTF